MPLIGKHDYDRVKKPNESERREDREEAVIEKGFSECKDDWIAGDNTSY
jgi:hypothetical protein